MRLLITVALIFHFIQLYPQSSDISMNDTLDLEQLVISASRVDKTDAVTFQNISLREIEEVNLGQDPVVLIERLSPSIVTYSDGGTDIGNYSQLRLRGIDQSRINMTLNGVPLNDMADHGTYFSNFSDFGNSIQSIQIRRGAGSTQTGVAAYGGAINFESINIFGSAPHADAQVTIGSFGTMRAAGEVSTGTIQNGLGFYGRMTKTSTDGYKYNSGSDSYSFFFSGGRVGDNDLLKVTAFSGSTQNGQSYLNVPLTVINDDPRTNYNDLNDIDDFEQRMIQLQYARNLNNNTTISVTPYYNGAGGVFPFSFDGDQYMFGLENDHYGVLANVERKYDNSVLKAGLHGYFFDRSNFEYITPFVTAPYTRDFTDKNEFSSYLKYTRLLDHIDFTANVELRSISMNINGDADFAPELNIDNSWTFINGTIGINYSLNDQSSSYISIAHTNREPTRSDILNGVGNSESVIDFELGYNYRSDKFKIESNLFLMSFRDEISSIGALQELSYMEIRQNVDRSSRYGLEASISYDIQNKFSAMLNMAWMDTNIDEYNNGNEILSNVNQIFSPNWVIQPSLTYNLSDQVGLTLSSRYVSDSFTELSNNPDFILPSHFVLNAQADVQITSRLSASFMLNNVFDQLYFTEGGPIDVDFDGIVEGMGYRIQPPRHFYMMMKYSL